MSIIKKFQAFNEAEEIKKFTDNRGRELSCYVCKSKDTIGIESHTPAFGDAIDRVYMAYCAKHKDQVTKENDKALGSIDRLNQAGSNS